MVDTGCSNSVLSPNVCKSWKKSKQYVVTVDGSQIPCVGKVTVPLSIDSCTIRVNCLVANSIFGGIDVVVGMDVINRLGGVIVTGDRVVFFNTLCDNGISIDDVLNRSVGGVERVSEVNITGKSFENEVNTIAVAGVLESEITINDVDFEVKLNGKNWCIKWHWKDGKPPKLKNTTDCYESTLTPETRVKFDEEVESWIAKGWLRPYEGEPGDGIIPLMAVVQANKNKVRPVMDYRELNEYVECHPGTDASACDETLRRWRRMKEPLKILDLKSAYLQIHIDSSLWPYQKVCFKGKLYCLTRLGFGLCSAPKIMSKILQEVLARDECVCKNTDSYIDDIFVREDGITVEEVAAHLHQYGLESKPPENLEGGRVLGLNIHRNANNELMFS